MQITIDLRAILIAILVLALILHTVSVEMRIADITRRLESDERSTERLSQVWWQNTARQYESNDHTDERALIALTEQNPS